jgi:hypothetical protein
VLAADHVGEAAEDERSDEGSKQHRGVEQGEPARTQAPVVGDQRGGDPDDEQVVGVGAAVPRLPVPVVLDLYRLQPSRDLAIKPWAKALMMLEAAASLALAALVISRAINIL